MIFLLFVLKNLFSCFYKDKYASTTTNEFSQTSTDKPTRTEASTKATQGKTMIV